MNFVISWSLIFVICWKGFTWCDWFWLKRISKNLRLTELPRLLWQIQTLFSFEIILVSAPQIFYIDLVALSPAWWNFFVPSHFWLFILRLYFWFNVWVLVIFFVLCLGCFLELNQWRITKLIRLPFPFYNICHSALLLGSSRPFCFRMPVWQPIILDLFLNFKLLYQQLFLIV